MGYILLFIIFSLGLLARSDLLLIASLILLGFKLIHLDQGLMIIDQIGIKVGLIFLLMAVLVPLVNGSISVVEILKSYKSILAFFAMISGLLATKIVGVGLDLLDQEPELIIAMLFGSIIGIVFFDGVPVGPLLAAGLTAIFYKIYSLLLI